MADVDRSTTRRANPVAITDRAGREAFVKRVDEADLTTTDAVATLEVGTLPRTNLEVRRQQVAYQRLILVELRVLNTLLLEQVTGWYDLDQMRQDAERALGII